MSIEPDENGEWPEPHAWPTVQADITCRTPGCPVADVTYHGVSMPVSVDGVYRAWCARCNTANDDVVIVSEETADA